MSLLAGYKQQIAAVSKLIKEADAVVVGGGSGMSSAAGYNHYHWTPLFQERFALFREAYGFQSLFEGFYYLYSSYEEQWGYYSQYIKFLYDAVPGQPYRDLYEILEDKPYFILTTNIDMQFSKIFPEERICLFQGDFRYLQCSQPCHDQIYPNAELIAKMNRDLKGTRIPTELVPRCQLCGRAMVPWVRDDTFLEGDFWKSGVSRYRDFLTLYQDAKVVFLELGVGDMTPNIIRLPFWKMTYDRPGASLVTINLGKAIAPEHLKGKAIAFDCNIAQCLPEIRQALISRER